jgi:hypothetical protein
MAGAPSSCGRKEPLIGTAALSELPADPAT